MESDNFLKACPHIERKDLSRDFRAVSGSNNHVPDASESIFVSTLGANRKPSSNVYCSDHDESTTEYISLPSPHSVSLNQCVGEFSLTRCSCFINSHHPTRNGALTIVEPHRNSESKTHSIEEPHCSIHSNESTLKSKTLPQTGLLPNLRIKKSILHPTLRSEEIKLSDQTRKDTDPQYPNFPHVDTSPSSQISRTNYKSTRSFTGEFNNESSDDENRPPKSAGYDVCKHFAKSLNLSSDAEYGHRNDKKQIRCNLPKINSNRTSPHIETGSVDKDCLIGLQDDDPAFQYLVDERERLQNKLNYIKLTSKAYRMRLAALDSNIKLVRSLASSSNRSVCECSAGPQEPRALSCKVGSFHHFSPRQSTRSEF